MAKDPAFLFYPGDYLQDTQGLGCKAQVAYDRIMCLHMKNICISKSQLKFVTKRMSEDEIEELMMVLTEIEDGYQIEWVAQSISKRKAYSESRRKNRQGKTKNNISTSYEKHMENENVIEDVDTIEEGKKGKKERSIKQPSAKRFVPPTVFEVRAYCEEMNYTALDCDPQKFIDYFEQVGWVIGGGKKMKAWKAAVRNWVRRSRERREKDGNERPKQKWRWGRTEAQ